MINFSHEPLGPLRFPKWRAECSNTLVVLLKRNTLVLGVRKSSAMFVVHRNITKMLMVRFVGSKWRIVIHAREKIFFFQCDNVCHGKENKETDSHNAVVTRYIYSCYRRLSIVQREFYF